MINMRDDETLIDADDLDQLIPKPLVYLRELNVLESENNLVARSKYLKRKNKQYLTQGFLEKVHRDMFGYVWRWAGQYRKTNKNIGIEWFNVQGEVKKLIEDTQYWIENETYEEMEILARFHHRLVYIHPFTNGNGRHSRLMTDIINFNAGFGIRICWLKKDRESNVERCNYIDSLRQADDGVIAPLVNFLRGKTNE